MENAYDRGQNMLSVPKCCHLVEFSFYGYYLFGGRTKPNLFIFPKQKLLTHRNPVSCCYLELAYLRNPNQGPGALQCPQHVASIDCPGLR